MRKRFLSSEAVSNPIIGAALGGLTTFLAVSASAANTDVTLANSVVTTRQSAKMGLWRDIGIVIFLSSPEAFA